MSGLFGPGVAAEDLQRIKRGILAVALGRPVPPEPEEVNEEAAELARTTVFSYSDWCEALRLIGDRPGRAELIKAAAEAALIMQEDAAQGVYGWTLPHTVGVLLAWR